MVGLSSVVLSLGWAIPQVQPIHCLGSENPNLPNSGNRYSPTHPCGLHCLYPYPNRNWAVGELDWVLGGTEGDGGKVIICGEERCGFLFFFLIGRFKPSIKGDFFKFSNRLRRGFLLYN